MFSLARGALSQRLAPSGFLLGNNLRKCSFIPSYNFPSFFVFLELIEFHEIVKDGCEKWDSRKYDKRESKG